MSTISKRGRRPDHAATSHGGRRRRGRSLSAERLFDPNGRPAASPLPSAKPREAEAGSERQRRLEEVVLTTWAALHAGHPVECPVCGGPLTAASGCSGCGSRLS